MNRLIKTVIFILLTHRIVFAIPAITDSPSTIENGQVVNVVGTALTIKTVGPPLSYLDGVGTSEGQFVTDPDYDQNFTEKFWYTANGARNGRNSVYTIIEDWPNGAHFYYENETGFDDQLYYTFWTKLEVNGTYDTVDPVQIKWITVRTQPGSGGGLPAAGYNIYPRFEVTDSGATFTWFSMIGQIIHNQNGWSTVYAQNIQTYSEYCRYELYGKRASAPNVADGTWTVKFLQEGQAPETIINTDATITHGTIEEIWRYIGFRNENVNSSSELNEELKQWINGMWVDNSPNRFEIGNNSNFNSCTVREIQETITKTDTGGSFTAEQGSLAPNTQYYLFSVDNNNVPSIGVPIQFSSTAPNVTCQADDTTEETSYPITATYTLEGARTAVSCTWSNSLGGSGTLTATGGNISGTVTGLSTGDNTITITVTDSEAESGSCNTVLTRGSTPAPTVTATLKRSTLKRVILK